MYIHHINTFNLTNNLISDGNNLILFPVMRIILKFVNKPISVAKFSILLYLNDTF